MAFDYVEPSGSSGHPQIEVDSISTPDRIQFRES